MPVPRTRPLGLPGQARATNDPPRGAGAPTAPVGDVIRGGAAANAALDALLGTDGSTDDARLGTWIAGRYQLLQRLGTGAVGAVYLAQSTGGRRVAVKLLRRELATLPELAARFEREAAAARRVDHPNVAGALDFGHLDDGSLFLVLEYVAGASLAELLATTGPLPTERALRVARSIAAALGAAHRAGIVHRDLKPNNVMLTEHPDADTVKVVDFGVAQLPAEASAVLGPAPLAALTGTPEYMAPEQAAGTIVDHRADLYTLGIVLFEMLVGRPPFRDDSMDVVLRRQMTEPPPPLPARIDADTAALVGQLLAKDPDQRPRTADDVTRRIDDLLEPRHARRHPEARGAPSSSSRSSRPVSADEPAPPGVGTDGEPRLDSTLTTASSRRAVSRPVPPPEAERGGRWLGWVVGGVAALAVAAGTLHLTTPRRAVVGLAPPAPSTLGADEATLAARAATGDSEALTHLQRARPTLPATLMAIGHGFAVRGQASRSLLAYSRALDQDPTVAGDATLARDVRRAIDDPTASPAALELAFHRLGGTGLDIIHDAWATARRDTAQATLATRTKELLDDPSVTARASPPLRVALALWGSTTCDAYRELLPHAMAEGDARSVPVLISLARKEGCGPQQQHDCFPCLRRDDLLERATAAAAARPAPTF